MRHSVIMRHTIHTMFYSGSYFNARRSEKGNLDISGILLLLAFLWCPASDLSYLTSCFREYLKKLARKIRARFDQKNSHNSTSVGFYVVSTCDVAFLGNNSKNDADADANPDSQSATRRQRAALTWPSFNTSLIEVMKETMWIVLSLRWRTTNENCRGWFCPVVKDCVNFLTSSQ